MFGVTDYGAFIVAVIAFLFIPGPGNLVLIISTSTGGLRGGFAAACGVIVGDQILIWLALFGAASVLKTWPPAFGILQWLGAAYLAWIGVRMLWVKKGDAPPPSIQSSQYFQQAISITLFNPKAIMFYLAFFPLFIDPTQKPDLITFSFMAATVAGLTFLYAALVILLTNNLADRMRASPRANAALNKIAGVLLIGLGFKLLLLK